ncbi:MAG: carbon-nitrogen hydrolase family protein [Acidobacteriota bacterium]
MSKLRLAVVQAEIAPSLAAGLEATADLARRAAASGAQVIVFPETWLPGYPAWLDVCRDVALWDHEPVKKVFARYAGESVVVHGSSGQALGAIAKEVGAVLVIGVSERVEEGPGRGTLYNTLLTYGPDGTLRNHHRKLMPTYTERMIWGQGDAAGLRAIETSVGRVGGLICWEHWMPLARQAMHESGEDLHVAAWPNVHEMLQVASRSYAFEGRCYVAAAGSLLRAKDLPPELEPHPAKVQSPEQWILRGGSAIYGPDGFPVVEPVFDREEILVADLDLNKIREENMSLDVGGHYSRPDQLSFEVRRGTRDAG